jgi:membrane peptidoglycan carboxypeptidase
MTPRLLKIGAVGVILGTLAAFVSAYIFVQPELSLINHQLATSRRYSTKVDAAIIAAEDPVFLGRSRVDTIASFAATVGWSIRNLVGGHVVVDSRASLTERLVRSNVQGHLRPLVFHFKVLAVAAVLDATCSKQDLLNAYIDNVYLGRLGQRQVHGFDEGAREYFGVRAQALTPSQTISLAASIRNPSVLNPRVSSELAIRRRLLLLDAVHGSGAFTEHEISAAREELRPATPNSALERTSARCAGRLSCESAERAEAAQL